MRPQDADAITNTLIQAGFPAHFVNGPEEDQDHTYGLLRVQCEPGDIHRARLFSK